MGKEQNTDKLSRRDFLKISGIISGISLLTLLGIDQLLINGAVRQHAEDLLLGAINYNAPEFEDFSSLEKCLNKGRAFWIVHRGYLAALGLSTVTEDHNIARYPEYWRNTKRLLDYLEMSGEPTFLEIEDRVFKKDDFTKDPHFLIIVSINMKGSIKRFIHTSEGLREQNIEKIKSCLQKTGINTVCFAGEVAHKGSGITGGCVIDVAEYFRDGFDIKGVEGCVYPLEPPRHPSVIQKELYFDTIPIPTL